MVSSFSRSTSSHFSRRGSSFGSPRVVGHWKSWVSRSFHLIVVIGSLVSFLLAVGCGYLYVFPSISQAIHGHGISKFIGSIEKCDIFEGSWVPDHNYPLYNGSECPFAERGFDCLGNGRNDTDYLKWRWKPNNCVIPRFNVHMILERLRGKRVVFVGDSMSRTQWESMICLLMTGVADKKSVYEISGNKITKRIRVLRVRFSSFNFTVEFFRSVFLVQHSWVPRNGPRRVRSTLKLDKLDDISKEWIDSDILIFNTGQWWTPGKLFDTLFEVVWTWKFVDCGYRRSKGSLSHSNNGTAHAGQTFKISTVNMNEKFDWEREDSWWKIMDVTGGVTSSVPEGSTVATDSHTRHEGMVGGRGHDRNCYFQVGGSLKLGMSIPTAFRIAVDTWASWIESMVNTNRTQVFFRTFEPSHWSDQTRRFCNVTQFPSSETKGRDQSPFSDIIFEVMKNMKVPITVLHVTSMGAFRSDAHVGTWSDTPLVPDCSHWCLPGVPDVWNEILFSYLLGNFELTLQLTGV
ncbi:hypothetical protein HHK36_009263 [Tetracentron sinense]|uniref:Trichome birefringence-like N-terminal domain-containing protein n=1 Tax=Tetracentron sinense TaxID=13715 RepID=A0A834ZF71_TETSI|nr:hypothetical protein HHK36_009263 [Tetracentron sinense]